MSELSSSSSRMELGLDHLKIAIWWRPTWYICPLPPQLRHVRKLSRKLTYMNRRTLRRKTTIA